MPNFSAAPDVARVAAACVLLYGLSGFAAVRLWLPESLRRHELLWVMPVGAVLSALALTVLGFAAVPFHASLAAVLVAGAGTSAYALRRAGAPSFPRRDPGTVLWPAYLAVLIGAVALIPVFRFTHVTVIGPGSDAHLAAGTAEFLQKHYPTAIAPEEPVDRVPLVWRSKQPVYYGLGAVASLSGFRTYEALPVLAAVLLAMAAAGFFLLARDVLSAGMLGALLAMTLAGLDRMVLHTVMHPYFNQTWGFFTLPFAIVLGWEAFRRRTAGGVGLLVAFLAVGAFAYPLALPIPLIVLGAVLRRDRRERRARGDEVRSLDPRRLVRRVYRGKRSLPWMVPLGFLLLVPVLGVVEKMLTAVGVVAPGSSLSSWGGDLHTWYPLHTFLSTGSTAALVVAAPFALWAIRGELRRLDRRLAGGLAAVLAFGALCAVYFRLRDAGWYFHFKALAFIGPLAVAIAVVGIARWREAGHGRWLRWAATLGLIALFLTGFRDTTTEVRTTFPQLYPFTTDLRTIDARLPAKASIRMDMDVNEQLWAAYMLHHHPLCSQRPLLGTSYPHVPISRRADYVLADRDLVRPFDAVGRPLWENVHFVLYQMRASVPGPNRCSQTMVQTVKRVA